MLVDAVDISPHFYDDAHQTEDLGTVVSEVLSQISHGRPSRVAPAAMRVISRYSWPRNITQPEDLPGYCHDSARRQLTGMETLERDAIVNALRQADGNRGAQRARWGW